MKALVLNCTLLLQQYNLKIHVQSFHQNIRPFVCPKSNCNKSFHFQVCLFVFVCLLVCFLLCLFVFYGSSVVRFFVFILSVWCVTVLCSSRSRTFLAVPTSVNFIITAILFYSICFESI